MRSMRPASGHAVRAPLRVLTVVGLLAGLALVGAAPAAGTITRVTGDCVGTGDFDPGGLKDAASAEVTIPQEATVEWFGGVLRTEPDEPREVNGSVWLELPMGQTITLGKWPSSGVLISNDGTYTYELPSVLAGFDMTFAGEHFEENMLWCTGRVTVRVEGTNPLGIPSVALFVVSVVGVSLSIRARNGGTTAIHEITPGEPYDV